GGRRRQRQGRRLLAHAGFGQKYFDGHVCRETVATTGDAEPDDRGGDGPQRPRRSVVRAVLRGERPTSANARAGRRPRAAARDAGGRAVGRNHLYDRAEVFTVGG